MSTEIDDGGPAFPCKLTMTYSGASLRDYFAAAALTGVMANADFWGMTTGVRVKAMDQQASMLYEIADSMLAARKGGAK